MPDQTGQSSGDSSSQSSTPKPPHEDERPTGRDFTAHLQKLTDHINAFLNEHAILKPKLDKVTKDLAVLGFKPGDVVDQGKLPIDVATIERTVEALKDGGKNVKGLQKALGIFDYAEMTRIRKALFAAEVTRETENFRGSNATWIELNAEAAQR